LLDEHTTFVREMEQELKAAQAQKNVGHKVPEMEPGVKRDNDKIPQISKMQIDLMVNSFAADFARVATLQITNSVGMPRICLVSRSNNWFRRTICQIQITSIPGKKSSSP
jgi:hypothetical protein